MIEAARARLAPFGADRVRRSPTWAPAADRWDRRRDPVHGNLPLGPRPRRLFANLAAVLRPSGRLVAQCGGAGNIATVKAVLATIGDGWIGRRTTRRRWRPEPARCCRLRRHRVLADRRADAVRARRAVRDVPAHGHPRAEPGAAPGERARRLRPRGRRPDAGAADRLRPAQHHRPPGGRGGSLTAGLPRVSRGPGTRRRVPG